MGYWDFVKFFYIANLFIFCSVETFTLCSRGDILPWKKNGQKKNGNASQAPALTTIMPNECASNIIGRTGTRKKGGNPKIPTGKLCEIVF
jgi:hypothetical protein